jgi:hypothetical protein
MEFPIMTVLQTGTAYLDEPFNYFFSLCVAVGWLLIVPAAIFAVIKQSLRG